MAESRNWTRDELIVAFNLYCKTTFGRIHNRNPDIISLAKLLDRSPSAVSWKLANFARLDPSLQKRDIAGASHGSKLEQEVWDEFNADWDKLAFESEVMRTELVGGSLPTEDVMIFPEGKTRVAEVQIRVNQSFFRSAVLAAYDSRCCVTGMGINGLLCASHIVPWSVDVRNRTNPRNGLCLNALHDRAFDRGLFTLNSDFEVLISPLIENDRDPALQLHLLSYAGKKIRIPEHFQPDESFLKHHRDHIFQAEA
jgi:putative restriction endonuclease